MALTWPRIVITASAIITSCAITTATVTAAAAINDRAFSYGWQQMKSTKAEQAS